MVVKKKVAVTSKKIKTGKKVRKPKIVNSMRGLNTTQQRMKHVSDMYGWGHAGVNDYNELNRVVVPETTENVRGGNLITLPPHFDVQNHDMPRRDIKRYDIKSDDYVRIGGDSGKNIRAFAQWGFPILGRALSNDELQTLRVYYDYPSQNRMFKNTTGEVTLGLTSSEVPGGGYMGLPYSMIEFHRLAMGDEPTLIHETIHAVRANEGNEIRDRDKDEAFVELETLARVSPRGYKQMLKLPGYYSYLTNYEDKMRQDRILITGGINKSLVGRNATRRVASVFPQTNIWRLRGASSGVVVDRKGKQKKIKKIDVFPEWVDRYFEVVVGKNRKINIHMRFGKPVSPGNIITKLKVRYPDLIKVNEWHDGKRKLIYSRSHKGERNTTTQQRRKRVVKPARHR